MFRFSSDVFRIDQKSEQTERNSLARVRESEHLFRSDSRSVPPCSCSDLKDAA